MLSKQEKLKVVGAYCVSRKKCKRCKIAEECELYRRAKEQGNAEREMEHLNEMVRKIEGK